MQLRLYVYMCGPVKVATTQKTSQWKAVWVFGVLRELFGGPAEVVGVNREVLGVNREILGPSLGSPDSSFGFTFGVFSALWELTSMKRLRKKQKGVGAHLMQEPQGSPDGPGIQLRL